MPDFKNKEEYEKWKAERLQRSNEEKQAKEEKQRLEIVKKEEKQNSNNISINRQTSPKTSSSLKNWQIILIIFVFVSIGTLLLYSLIRPSFISKLFSLPDLTQNEMSSKDSEKSVDLKFLNEYPHVNVSGVWTGIATNNYKSVLFEITITHNKTGIEGNGYAQVTGSLAKSIFNVTGFLKTGEAKKVLLAFRGSDVFENFDGTVSDSTLTGELSGVHIEKQEMKFIKK